LLYPSSTKKMNLHNVAQLIPTAQEALRAFLSTLLGADASLTIDPPVDTTLVEASGQAMAYLNVLAEGPGLRYGIMLDEKWLGLASNAMLGETLPADDPGAEDLIRELAGQAHGAVIATLSQAGLSLSEVSFRVLPPGSSLPTDALDEQLLEISFGMNIDGQSLGGFALVPAHAGAGMDTESIGAAPPRAAAPGGRVEVAPLAYPDLGAEHLRGDGGNMNFNVLADVELEITVELGRRRLPLAELLRLTTGSVVELEKLVGEPLEVYANGRLIAEGEAVVIDEQFGIRITNLSSTRQRTKAFV
jgi:flagellar motor switch protein FliN